MNLFIGKYLLILLFLLTGCKKEEFSVIGSYETDLKFYVDYEIPDGQNLWVLMQIQYEGPHLDSIKGIKQQIKIIKDFVEVNNYELTLQNIRQSINANQSKSSHQQTDEQTVLNNFQLIFDKLNIQIVTNVTLYQQIYVKIPSIQYLGPFVDKILQIKQINSLNFNIIGIQWLDQIILTSEIQENLENKYLQKAYQIGKASAIERCHALNMDLASINSFQQVLFDQEQQKEKNIISQQIEDQINQEQSIIEQHFTYEEALDQMIQDNSLFFQNRFYQIDVTCTGEKSPMKIKQILRSKEKSQNKKLLKTISKGKQLEKQLKKQKNNK